MKSSGGWICDGAAVGGDRHQRTRGGEAVGADPGERLDGERVVVLVDVVEQHVDHCRLAATGIGFVVVGDRRFVAIVVVEGVDLLGEIVRFGVLDLLLVTPGRLLDDLLGVAQVKRRGPVGDLLDLELLLAHEPDATLVDVVHPHPAVDERELDIGARGWELERSPAVVEHRSRRPRHRPHAAAVHDRGDRVGSVELGDHALGAVVEVDLNDGAVGGDADHGVAGE